MFQLFVRHEILTLLDQLSRNVIIPSLEEVKGAYLCVPGARVHTAIVACLVQTSTF